MGWMIVMKPECDDDRKWLCGHPAPSWCDDLSATVSRPLHVIDGDQKKGDE